MYQCGRCEQTFKDEGRLVQHLQNTVPCDWVCRDCGLKLNCKSSYVRHKNKRCHPVKVEKSNTDKENLNVPIKMNNNNNFTGNNNNVINIQMNNNFNNINNTYNIEDFNLKRVSKYGIVAIENEQGDLMELHKKQLWNMFISYIKTQDIKSYENLRNLLIEIVALFHSNKNTPENLNIVSTSDDADRNQVYSGKEFVDDFMTKNIRDKRVLQLIIQQINRFSEFIDVIRNKQLFTFINDIFLPYLYSTYVANDTTIDFQNYWKNNMKMLETINYKNLPVVYEIDKRNRIEHLNNYRRFHHEIHMKLAKVNSSDINSAIEKCSSSGPK